jgi:hypothetical protein
MMREGTTTEQYRLSMGKPDTDAMFSDDPVEALAYQWQDKPHRHVYDLCGEIDALNIQLLSLKQEIVKLNKKIRQERAIRNAQRKR